ncbi:MAG: HAMP domain-containing histidine kinase [Butyrivibrio sp.]|nr:HAMP domain-containing histidine kinase [Butyrivibrio sp.]
MKNKYIRNMIMIGSTITVLAVICGFFLCGAAGAAISFALGIAMLAVFINYTGKRYSDIAQLNDYLDKVLAENYPPEIQDQEEGELSILKTNIYKVTGKLKHQKERLANDKLQLATAIADISHQLKTPLTSMMVMNDLLMDEEDPERRQEFLQTQSAQLARMNWLIQTLLKLSKLDAGSVALGREEIPAKELVVEATKAFEIQRDLKNIALLTNVSDMTVKCDKNWTIEALQNIIKNCIEHMDAGGKLTIETEDTSIFSCILISDTGCGIAADDIPHIFERFYKGKNAGKDSVGIGLALTKTIIENQHGQTSVRSTEGAGTTFEIRLYKTIV